MSADPSGAPRERRSQGGLLFPLILVAIGVAFLAANLGYIQPISIRALAALWPLILIVVGIEILFARREPLLALGLQLAVIAVGVALVAAQPGGLFARPVSAGSSSIDVARDSTTALTLRVSGGAGRYEVSGGAANLVEARSTGGEVQVRTTRSAGRTEVRVSPEDDHFDLFRPVVPSEVIVRAASDVPTAVRVEGGAGEFVIDLSAIQTTEADVEGGAGEFTVVLPHPKGTVPVRIEAGAASITIRVPDGVEARVTTRGGALSFSSENPRLEARSGAAETTGYAAATDRVNVTFEGGAASIRVR
jgi:hypothetical protein